VQAAYALGILLPPLVGALLIALAGARLGRASGVIASAMVLVSFAFTAWATLHLLSVPPAHRSMTATLFTWGSAGGLTVGFSTLLDPLSLIWALVITGVGGLIHIYSIGYMADDDGYPRFFTYMNLFVLAMLLVVVAANFLILLIGWAGVGLASYLLIGFWYTRESAVRAAKKAFVINVIGDIGIVFAIFVMYTAVHSTAFSAVFGAVAAHRLSGGTLEAVAILLLLGAAAKSAQFPLHTWLPDAMEGPTPVSALIHAATMVTAGVYLVARSYPIFHAAPVAGALTLDIGAFTAIFAAVIALTQNDIKRVLAYSTLSQLGYMFMAVGAGAYVAGVFHFLTHAFFKALLFLGAGSVIHALGGEQDMRKMGGLARAMPLTYVTFLAATLAISGMPPLAGFFSKDQILGDLLGLGHLWPWLVGVVTAGLTALYMFRLFFLTFHGERRGALHPHESPPVMATPLVILAVLAVTGGWLAVPGAWDALSGWLGPVFAAYPGGVMPAAATAPNWGAMALTVAVALCGIAAADAMYRRRVFAPARLRRAFGWAYTVCYRKFYVDEFYDAAVVRPVRGAGRLLAALLERDAIQTGVAALAAAAARQGETLTQLQSGPVRRYALTFLGGVALVILILALR
jgi:NADH-quinone oxidoreductase subunit L